MIDRHYVKIYKEHENKKKYFHGFFLFFFFYTVEWRFNLKHKNVTRKQLETLSNSNKTTVIYGEHSVISDTLVF